MSRRDEPAASPSADLRRARQVGYESTRPDIRALVPPTTRRLLDLGCSSGALGSALKEARADGVEVVGIEGDPAYARDARGRLDRVECLDLNRFPAEHELRKSLGTFDCLVAGDVLEHLQDPWEVLGCAADLLREGGTAIVSLPNVRHWTVARAVFVRGSWDRRDAGIFDRTHLRWFTLGDAEHLMAGAGLTVTDISRRYWEGRRGRLVFALVNRTAVRDFFARQYLISGVRALDAPAG